MRRVYIVIAATALDTDFWCIRVFSKKADAELFKYRAEKEYNRIAESGDMLNLVPNFQSEFGYADFDNGTRYYIDNAMMEEG